MQLYVFFFKINVNFNALVVYASMIKKKEELVSGPSR